MISLILLCLSITQVKDNYCVTGLANPRPRAPSLQGI